LKVALEEPHAQCALWVAVLACRDRAAAGARGGKRRGGSEWMFVQKGPGSDKVDEALVPDDLAVHLALTRGACFDDGKDDEWGAPHTTGRTLGTNCESY